MKEFIEKLIKRLEELKELHAELIKDGLEEDYHSGCEGMCVDIIEIVNELAEEYKLSEMPTSWIIDGKGIHKQTNADRIRSMTDEELAEFLDNMCLVKTDFHCEECNNPLNCDVCYLEWLQSEAE